MKPSVQQGRAALSTRPPPSPLSIVHPRAHGSLPSPDELAALVSAVAAGDRSAFVLLFKYFAPRLKSYLLRTGSEDDAAEELAQEAMAQLWRKAGQFDARQAGVSTWLYTIARNLRVDRLRRQGGDASTHLEAYDLDTLPEDAAAPDERVEVARQEAQVRAAIRRLPPEQAEVLRLSFYEEHPHEAIARELGIPLGTVKSRMRLAVGHLRRLLHELQ